MPRNALSVSRSVGALGFAPPTTFAGRRWLAIGKRRSCAVGEKSEISQL